jgi:hypothetical protein
MNIPKLEAYLEEGRDCNLWLVWCVYCQRWHIHGAGNKGQDPMKYLGLRAGHCVPASPYVATGYELVYGGLWQDLPETERRRR